jgi:hypothetical protein
MKDQQLAIVPQGTAAIERARPVPTVADMLQAVIERGVTQENVAAVNEIVKLYERMEDKKAEREFAQAFVALQAEMPSVKAVQPVPNRDGSLRYRFAPYEEIMEQVAPMLKRHGFTVTFSTDFAEGRLIKTCTLQHIGGHSKSNKFAVRIGSGPPGATESQADGAASTYAKRFALCDALNIQIDKDTDARAEGGTITPEQAEELERRVAETNSNREAFLKFAGAKKLSEIKDTKYDILDSFLRKKEQQGR